MSKLEEDLREGLTPSIAEPAPSPLAQLRQERERRRRRARWLAASLSVLGVAFVAQGFARQPPVPRELVSKSRPGESLPRTAQPQATAAARPLR